MQLLSKSRLILRFTRNQTRQISTTFLRFDLLFPCPSPIRACELFVVHPFPAKGRRHELENPSVVPWRSRPHLRCATKTLSVKLFRINDVKENTHSKKAPRCGALVEKMGLEPTTPSPQACGACQCSLKVDPYSGLPAINHSKYLRLFLVLIFLSLPLANSRVVNSSECINLQSEADEVNADMPPL
jgi:hypothetical protein